MERRAMTRIQGLWLMLAGLACIGACTQQEAPGSARERPRKTAARPSGTPSAAPGRPAPSATAEPAEAGSESPGTLEQLAPGGKAQGGKTPPAPTPGAGTPQPPPAAGYQRVDSQHAATTAPAPRTYVIKKGDTLSDLARRYYGKAGQWRRIYEANEGVISDPNKLPAGATIVVP